MSKRRVTAFDLGYGLAGQLHVFQIPAGMRVRRATNLPKREGKWTYWLNQIPPAYKKDSNFLWGMVHLSKIARVESLTSPK